jgi:catechol 2,3-dioxygenase-like lactoylglutathione lyase family enzyme
MRAHQAESDSFKTIAARPPSVMRMAPTFDVVGLVVADMGKSLAFYRRLGLDVPADADAEPHVEHRLPGGLRLCWDTIETIHSFWPEWTPPTGDGRIGIAFVCDSPAEVDRVYADLVQSGSGSIHEPFDAFWGQRYATVRDPDGNAVDLFAARDE